MKPDNIMVQLEDRKLLYQSARDEFESPLPQKHCDDGRVIYLHIARANPRHEGWHFVRKLIDSFSIQGASGSHICLVFDPLREPLGKYCRRWRGGAMPPQLFKIILQMILQALDYLHSECHIIHTGWYFSFCWATI